MQQCIAAGRGSFPGPEPASAAWPQLPPTHAPPAMPLIKPPPRSQATSAMAAAAASVDVLVANGSAEPPLAAAKGSAPPPLPAAKGSPPEPLAAAKGSVAAALLLAPVLPPGAANGSARASAWNRRRPNRLPKSPKVSNDWQGGGRWVSEIKTQHSRGGMRLTGRRTAKHAASNRSVAHRLRYPSPQSRPGCCWAATMPG